MRQHRKLIVSAFVLLVLLIACGTAGALNVFDWSGSDWMQYLPNNAYITEINLPGTHDAATATINPAMALLAKCQDWTIDKQLEHGVRFFDLRVRYEWDTYLWYKTKSIFTDPNYDPGKLYLSHGGIACYESLALTPVCLLRMSDVLKYCNDFLAKHPSETIILSVMKETLEPTGDLDDYTKMVEKAITNLGDMGGRIYYLDKDNRNVPKLKDVRGKIVIIPDIYKRDESLYTNVESHYGSPGLEGKANCIRKVLNDRYVGNQDYLKEHGAPRFVYEDKYYDHANLNKDPAEPGEPQVKIVQTNATDVSPSLELVTGHWPRAYADYENKVTPQLITKVGKRYGWFLIDFPPESLIRLIGESNNITAQINPQIIWKDGIDRDLSQMKPDEFSIRIVDADTGEVLADQKDAAFSSTTGSVWRFRFEDIMLYNEKCEERNIVAQVQVADRTMEIEYGQVEKNWMKYTNYTQLLLTQSVMVYPAVMTDLPFRIRWDDPMTRKDRPDLEKLLKGYSLYYGTIERDMIRVTGTDEYDPPYITANENSDSWDCVLHDVPNRKKARECLRPYISDLLPNHEGSTWWNAYTVTKSVEGGIPVFTLTEKGDIPQITLSGVVSWADGEDKLGWYAGAVKDVTATVVGKVKGETVVNRNIDVIFNRTDETYKLKSKVPQFDKASGGMIEYTVSLPSTLLRDGPGYYSLNEKESCYYLTGNINVQVEWDDNHDENRRRPASVGMYLSTKNKNGSYTRGTHLTVKKERGGYWTADVKDVPLFRRGDTDLLVYGVISDPVNAYRVKDVTFTPADQSTSYGQVTVTYEYSVNGMVNINGALYWIDGLAVDAVHPADRPDLYFIKKNDTVKYSGDAVWKSDDTYTCSFRPADVDTDPELYTMYIENGDTDHYTAMVDGFDVLYVRQVNITGIIDSTAFRTMHVSTSYDVQLLRDGVPTGDTARANQTGDGIFSFDFAAANDKTYPAADMYGNAYHYDVAISTESTKRIYDLQKDDPMVNPLTGDVTIYAVASEVDMEIPVTLTFDGIDPDEVTDAFTFTLEMEDSGRKFPELVLNRQNGFQGVFDLTDEDLVAGIYRLYVKQTIGGDPLWEQDRHWGNVLLEIGWNEDGKAVASVKIDQTASTDFVNIRHAAVCFADLPIKTILDYSQKPDEVKKPDYVRCTYELLLNPGTANESVMDYVSAVNGEDVSFTDIDFVAPGTYQLGVRQQPMIEKYWMADPEMKLVTFDVTEVGGLLQVTADPASLTFTSVFKPNGYVSVSVPVTKRLDGPDTDAAFDFLLSNVFDPDDVTTAQLTGASKGSFLPLVFYTPGTYIYEATEVEDPANPDWHISPVAHEVIITVSYNAAGDLTAAIDPAEGVTFTNVYAYDDLPVTVVWKDNNNEKGLRPDTLSLRLVKNKTVEIPYTAAAAEGWQKTLTHLPYYSAAPDTRLINTYELTAIAPAGYVCDVEMNLDDQGNRSFVVTCAEYEDERVDVPVTVRWIDQNNSKKLRPDNVNVLLLDEDQIRDMYLVAASADWKHTFAQMPRVRAFDEEKHPISYRVYAHEVDGYYGPEITGDMTNGFVITYTLGDIPMTEVSASIRWDDKNDVNKLRPKSVTVRLYADGKEVQQKKVTAESGWKCTFTDLVTIVPRGVEGTPIEYTVSCDEIRGYHEPEVSGDAEKGYVITCRILYIPVTGDASDPALLAGLILLSGAAFCLLRRKRRRD